uniref:Uncharacterized protein LOC111118043 n=1 Tax=Crassostrea virginica TaxID=6565 RepID=A0A8B8CEL9_CRAVI|nr:uncharacterized protein LOC111118043 [Crassostrea virginica]
MAVKNYTTVLCLVVTFSNVFATSSTVTTSVSESTESTTDETITATISQTTTDGTTSTQATTITTAQATTTATRNISCHEYDCKTEGCIKTAMDNSTISIGLCFTNGSCFVKRTSNSTYTEESIGCVNDTVEGCLTSLHGDDGWKRVCCTTDNCNNNLNAFNTNSLASSESYLMSIFISLSALFLQAF